MHFPFTKSARQSAELTASKQSTNPKGEKNAAGKKASKNAAGAQTAQNHQPFAPARADQTGKFKMPVDFYKRVLELEKEVDKLKENCSEPLLKGLTQIYSEAIEYFGYIDQVDRCIELQMRMQSILVKPYVLECLNRFERERLEEEARSEMQNPKQRVVFQSTKKQLEKLRQQMLIDKEREAKELLVKGRNADGDEPVESEDESTDSSEEDDDDEEAQAQAVADIDAIVKTPRANFRVLDFLRIGYEEGQTRIEMLWYTQQKIQAKKEAPVSKVHEKKNFKGLHESEEVAVNLVRSSLKTQSETLKERLQQRKLKIFRRRQNQKALRGNNKTNQTVIEGLINDHRLDSPNMSRISPMDTTQKSGDVDDSVMLQIHEGDKSLLVDDGHSILKNLDSEINNEDMPSGDEDDEAEDDPEMLAELDAKQEELIEEFMGRTFDLKTEKVEEMRAQCKSEGLAREETKSKVGEVEKKVVTLRRQGVKALKQMFAEIVGNEEQLLQQKVAYFSEDANLEAIRAQMDQLLEF